MLSSQPLPHMVDIRLSFTVSNWDSRLLGSATKKGLTVTHSRSTSTFLHSIARICNGKLDVVVHSIPTGIYFVRPFEDFKIGTTICMDAVFVVDSVETFEKEVIKRRPCVDMVQWKGSNNQRQFSLIFQQL